MDNLRALSGEGGEAGQKQDKQVYALATSHGGGKNKEKASSIRQTMDHHYLRLALQVVAKKEKEENGNFSDKKAIEVMKQILSAEYMDLE